MKVKRYKHAKKILSFYKYSFGIHEPYQVIVDGTFCQAALQGKIQIKEQLPKYFGGSVQLVTTKCVVGELHSLGEELLGAFYVAKRFQQRKCSHCKKAKPAAECILSLVGEENPHHYFVATQDPELRSKLRDIPGIPLLHIVRNTIVLEAPSDASQQKAEELSTAKVNPSEYEQSVIASLSALVPPEDGGGKGRRRKRVKGPNPLSIKRSQKLILQSRTVPTGMVSKSKKRRMRLQKRKAIELLAQVVQSIPAMPQLQEVLKIQEHTLTVHRKL